MEAGQPLRIFGDGETGQDYTYADDIVAGVLAALDYDYSSAPETPFEICNLCNSQPVKLLELAGMLDHATGEKAIFRREAPQQDDVP